MKRLLVFLILVVFGISDFLHCDNTIYLTPRVAALGGAFSAIANDENALFYNPAGLAKVTTTKINIVSPQFRLGEGWKKIKDITDDLNNANTDSQRADVLRKFIPTDISLGINSLVLPYYITGNFGVGLFPNGNLRLEVLNPVTPRIEVSGSGDIILVAGYAKKLQGMFEKAQPEVREILDNLTVGASIKIINKGEIVDKRTKTSPVVLGATELAGMDEEKIKDDYVDTQTATGVGIDIGVLYRLDEKTNLSLVLHNIGDTNFSYKDASGNTWKRKSPMSITLGGSYIYELPEKYKESLSAKDILLAADLSDIGTGGTFWKKVHLGAETTVLRKINVRTGINQGYLTFGFGYRLGILQVDYAYYQEERGRYAGQVADKSHLINLTLRF